MDAPFPPLHRCGGPPAPGKWTRLVLVLASLLSSRAVGIRVIGGNRTVLEGANVVLPCIVTDTEESITQISWQKRVQAKPQSDNFFTVLKKNGVEYVGEDKRFSFAGNIEEQNGSLRLSNVKLSDEAIFVCIFTMFPSGNFRTEIPLTVLVPPVIRVEDDHPSLGNKPVSLATCTAALSKPQAEVKWIIDGLEDKLNSTFKLIEYENGTTTTISSLFGVPTKDMADQEVHCVIVSAAKNTQTLSFVIQVYYPPMDMRIFEKEDHSFECRADGYPKPDFSWSRADGATGEAMTPVLNNDAQTGLYQCVAANAYGRQHIYLSVTTRQGPCCGACCSLLGILLFIAAAIVGYKFYRSRGRTHGRSLASTPHPPHLEELEAVGPLSNGEENEE